MKTPLTLYGYWRSSASWRVRIALNLKGLSFENQPVNLLQGAHRAEEHVARNPAGQVPVLVGEEGGRPFTLTQSMAILEYLDERFPGPTLLPGTMLQRARARQMAEVINSGVHPLQNSSVLRHVETTYETPRAEWARWAMEPGLLALEQLACDSAGQFLVGDSISVADICLVPQLYNARRYGVDLKQMPTLVEVERNCEAVDAFALAHPDRQPDAH